MPKSEPTYQKLRGGYYTPKPIADFLARWAVQSGDARILEPSCGDGQVLSACVQVLLERGSSKQGVTKLIHAVEIDRQEALKALRTLEAQLHYVESDTIQIGDFFTYCRAHLNDQRLFDSIVGNPPFIRYQNFPEAQRIPAFELMGRAQMKPNRLTNAWVPFLVASSLLLSPTGRLAMVIPAELLQVNYAAELRLFLSKHFSKLTLITFKKLVFEGIQQEVVLLLGERNGRKQTGIRTIELNTIDDLANYEHADFSKSELKPLHDSKDKWTQYFLTRREIELIRVVGRHAKLTRAREVLDVDVGVVTGRNEFFVLTSNQLKEWALEKYASRLVGRSGHLKGALFTEGDWSRNVENDYPSFLLTFPEEPFSRFSQRTQEYIRAAECANLHTGFKCRIRQPWYKVPSVWVPDAFMLRQIHAYPKLILNTSRATCTDTIHRVKWINGRSGRAITSAFLNSLTFAFAEVLGRSYGGGVLELEPSEAESLPLPLCGADKLDLRQIHHLLLRDEIASVLDMTDTVLLVRGLGLSRRDAKTLREIWIKLRDRRINRKHIRK